MPVYPLITKQQAYDWVLDYLYAFSVKAKQQGFCVHTYGQVGDFPLMAYTREAPNNQAPRYYVSAGIHGDEPAGPQALMAYLDQNYFEPEYSWVICPVLNPQSLAHNRRLDANSRDLNRDYILQKSEEVRAHRSWMKRCVRGHIDRAVLLHEDWEFEGFYLYAHRPGDDFEALYGGIGVVESVCPIHRAEVIEGRKACNGIAKVGAQYYQRWIRRYAHRFLNHCVQVLGDWCGGLEKKIFYQELVRRHPGFFSEMCHMLAYYTQEVYILESPLQQALSVRIQSLCKGMNFIFSSRLS